MIIDACLVGFQLRQVKCVALQWNAHSESFVATDSVATLAHILAMEAGPVTMNRYTVRKHIGVQFVRGFTLVELVMVMVLLGILAAYAAPRIFNRSDFDARGLHDVTMAYLRYAQKTAIAQRRQVCVAYTANSLTLTIAAAAGTGACPGAGVLNGPDGKTSLAAPANISYSPVPATVAFDALGQPLDSNGAVLVASRTVTVTGSGRTITVEAATGYVHD